MSGRRYPKGTGPTELNSRKRPAPTSKERRKGRFVEKNLGKIKPPKGAEHLVGEATIAAARALAAGGVPDYDAIRSSVIRGFAASFARAYGMVPRTAPVAAHIDVDTPHVFAFLRALESLDYAELTPEHFGHVHENLSGWHLDDGTLKPQSRGTVHFTPRSLTEPIVRKTLEPLLTVVPPERTLELRVCDPSVGAGAFLLELVRQLGQRLVDAGIEKDIFVAKRLVAVHCAYGTDTSRWAVASAKIALWLECRATAMPSHWLDDNIKVGDALVGLQNDQLARFHWTPAATKKGATIPEVSELRTVVDRAMAAGVHHRQARITLLAQAARGVEAAQ